MYSFKYMCITYAAIQHSLACICMYVVERLASIWRASEKEVMTLTLPDDCIEFKEYYDGVQEKISQISVLDELLAGL